MIILIVEIILGIEPKPLILQTSHLTISLMICGRKRNRTFILGFSVPRIHQLCHPPVARRAEAGEQLGPAHLLRRQQQQQITPGEPLLPP